MSKKRSRTDVSDASDVGGIKKTQALTPDVYAAKSDLSLTRGQCEAGQFRNAAHGGEFIYPSNPTLSGYSSSYHEAAITTDTFKFFRDAVNNKDGTHTLSRKASRNSFWENHTETKVYSQNLEYALRHADGFRADTAQAILSAPGGLAAGHSGSGVNTTGQAGAHDLLRKSIIDLLKTDPKTKGFSEKSFVVTLGAIVIASIAPGELARTVTGGTASLKAVATAQVDYEINPTEPNSTQDDVASDQRRKIPRDSATSPERDTGVASRNTLGGRGYLASPSASEPSKLLPTNIKELALYLNPRNIYKLYTEVTVSIDYNCNVDTKSIIIIWNS